MMNQPGFESLHFDLKQSRLFDWNHSLNGVWMKVLRILVLAKGKLIIKKLSEVKLFSIKLSRFVTKKIPT